MTTDATITPDPTATTAPTAPATAPAPTPAPTPTAAPTPTIGHGSVVSDADGRSGLVVGFAGNGNPLVIWLDEATEASLPITVVRA